MFLKGKVKKQSKEHYYTLQHITIINEGNVKSNPKWARLKSQYEDIEKDPNYDWPAYAITTFCNAVLTQERIYFIFGRDSFTKIIRKDTNWSKKQSFANEKWSPFMEYLLGEKDNHQYMELYKDGDNNTKIYRIVDEDLLSLLKVDEEKQLEECLIAAKNNDKKKTSKECENNDLEVDGQLDGQVDVVVSNKVISNKVISNECQNTSQDQSQDNYDFNLTMSLLFREEFGINERTDWSEINDQIDFLASYAVENIGIEDSTRRDFLNYLKELNRNKKFETKVNKYTGWSQKQFAELLADNFEKAVESYVYHAKKENKQLQIVEPQDTVKENRPTPRLTKEERKKKWQEAGQRETVNVLKADFANPALEALERQLSKAKDDDTRKMILQEIKMIRMVCYGN